ncbi:MAG TPA: hypothetical protein VFN35_16620, partial [Ktedonobacteraceae bacterium]|nr:hypothetical protein [Ktedonobacteraceae bacterium]
MDTSFSELPRVSLSWWQRPGWYHALTLSERLAGRPATLPHRAWSDVGRHEKAESRFHQWKAQAPFHSGTYFAERLAQDGITEHDLFSLLDESIEDVQARLPQPDWLQVLCQVFEEQASPDILLRALPELDEKMPTAAFLPSLYPLLAKGHQD